jgi:hypothetical protein
VVVVNTKGVVLARGEFPKGLLAAVAPADVGG